MLCNWNSQEQFGVISDCGSVVFKSDKLLASVKLGHILLIGCVKKKKKKRKKKKSEEQALLVGIKKVP